MGKIVAVTLIVLAVVAVFAGWGAYFLSPLPDTDRRAALLGATLVSFCLGLLALAIAAASEDDPPA